MPTTFATTGFAILVGLNSYGALAPVDKSLLPPGSIGSIFVNVDSCNIARGKMEHPEKYTCQIFTSAKSTAWTYTPPEAVAPPQQENSIQPDVNPEHRSAIEPTPEPAHMPGSMKPEPAQPAPAPSVAPPPVPSQGSSQKPQRRIVAQRTKQPQQHPRFDPAVRMLASLFTPWTW
jgi:hypothetical protein